MNYLDDELEKYDECTADALEVNDIIRFDEGLFYVVKSVEDAGTEIRITALDIEWEDELDAVIEPDTMFNLYKYKD